MKQDYSTEDYERAIAEAEGNISPEATSPASGPSTEELEAAIAEAEETISPREELAREMSRKYKRMARFGATGIAGLADFPNIGAMGLHAAGLKKTPEFYPSVGARAERAIDEYTGGELQPRNKMEEYEDVGGQAIAPLLLAPFTGGASLTGLGAKALSKGATSGIIPKLAKWGANTYKPTASNIAGYGGAAIGSKTYLDTAEKPNMLGTILSGIAGGGAGRSAVNLKNIGARAVGRATGFKPEEYSKLTQLGLEPSLADTSKYKLPGTIETFMSKVPGLQGGLKKHHAKQEATLARNVGISKPEDLRAAVKNQPTHLAKEGAEGYKVRTENIQKNLINKYYRIVKEAVGKKEPLDVSEMINNLEIERNKRISPAAQKRFDQTEKGKFLRELKERVEPGKPAVEGVPAVHDYGFDENAVRARYAKLGYPESVIEKAISEAKKDAKKITITPEIPGTPEVPAGTGIHYQDLEDLREAALQRSKDTRTALGESTAQSRGAKQVHYMASNRRHKFVEEKGTPKEVHASKKQKSLYEQYEAPPHKEETAGMAHYVRKITHAENNEKALNLLKEEPRYLSVARQGLPKSKRPQLAEAMISDLGKHDGRFNIGKFHSEFENLPAGVDKQLIKTIGNKQTQDTFKKTIDLMNKNERMMNSIKNISAESSKGVRIAKNLTAAGLLTASGALTSGATPLVIGGLLKGGAHLWTDQKFLSRVNKVLSETASQRIEKSLQGTKQAVTTSAKTKQFEERKQRHKVPRREENVIPYKGVGYKT